MAVKFSNNAVTTLSAGISAGATSFTVASASLFPTLASGDWTYVSLTSEVVKVTAISGTTFTCDAVTNAHGSGESVELRMTAELLNDFAEDTESLPLAGGTLTGNLSLGDNVKAKFGASDDLQIYHDGSHSRVTDTGTGNLILKGSTAVVFSSANNGENGRCTDGGGWALGYSGVTKLATTSTGIDVTGSVTCDGLTVDGAIVSDNTLDTHQIGKLQISYISNSNPGISSAGDQVIFYDTVTIQNSKRLQSGHQSTAGLKIAALRADTPLIFETCPTTDGNYSERLRIDSSGNVGIGTSSPTELLSLAGITGKAGIDITPSGWTVKHRFGALGTSGSANYMSTNFDPNTSTVDDSGRGTSQIITGSGGVVTFSTGATNTAPTERLRIDSSGRVGIGTSSPSKNLSVANYLEVGAQGGLDTVLIGGGSGIGAMTEWRYGIGGVINTRIIGNGDNYFCNNSGNVGIGTASPGANLHVKGNGGVARFEGSDHAYMEWYPKGASNGRKGYIGYGSPGNTDIMLYNENSGSNIQLGTNGSERLRIDSSGKVGIGTSSPGAKLQVSGADLGTALNDDTNLLTLYHKNTNTSYLEFTGERTSAGTDWTSAGTKIQQRIDATYMGYMQFNGDSNHGGISFGTGTSTTESSISERLRITSAGKVGIGTSSPSAKLHVETQPTGSGITPSTNADEIVLENNSNCGLTIATENLGSILFGKATDNDIGGIGYSMSDNSMRFTTNNTERLRIDSSGNVLARSGFTTTAHTNGIEQEYVNDGVDIAAGASISLFNIAQTYDNLPYELNVWSSSGSWAATKYIGVFGYSGFTTAVATGNTARITLSKTGTLYNETMTVTNNTGGTVSSIRFNLKIFGYRTVNSVSIGSQPLISSSYLTRMR